MYFEVSNERSGLHETILLKKYLTPWAINNRNYFLLYKAHSAYLGIQLGSC